MHINYKARIHNAYVAIKIIVRTQKSGDPTSLKIVKFVLSN